MNELHADDIVGSWMSDGWRFRLDIARDGELYAGTLAEGLENGEQDAANPDPALRTRPLLGSRLFDGLRFDNGSWHGGMLYNPETGKSYAMRLSLTGQNDLEMRAYVGLPLLGMSQLWQRQGYRPDLDAAVIASEAGLVAELVWSTDKAQAWYDSRAWPVGCNFIPSNAINQLEMWQARSFDIELIRHELDLARSIGFNCIRVYLHDIVWQLDKVGFLSRIAGFLDVAHAAGLAVLFVLFDDCWNDNPVTGRQPGPKPGVHNSGWVRSPGSRMIDDTSRWAELEDYVTGVIGAFRSDKRIYAWDLYNEIGNSVGFLPNSTRLLARTFLWARKARPEQPLTAGIWKSSSWFAGVNEFLATNSDIISFHDYSPPYSLRRKIQELSGYHKPIVCTEYMARTQGSTFRENLPVLRTHRVGAISWGLVAGKTQTIYPWGSRRGAAEPAVWFHDIFRPDGTPYDGDEIASIKEQTASPAASRADQARRRDEER
jgi:uncharacterized protein (DUF2147 family)